MTATAFGKPLDILRDGVVARKGSESRPLPLTETQIDIEIAGGLAVTRLTRKFSNAEAEPIEVLMTFPVGFHSVVTGLSARVGERKLIGKAQAKDAARETYEKAIARGELAVLHEEPLRGLNALSIAPLRSGVEVEVCAEIVTPLSPMDNGLFLRLPMTIGDVYGDSPLLPADDILTQEGVKSPAALSVRADMGLAKLGDGRNISVEPLAIELSQAIEIVLEGGTYGTLHGCAANGDSVSLSLSPTAVTREPLSCAILFDRSGSTVEDFPRSSICIWDAMKNGLQTALAGLSEQDQVTIWQFDSTDQCLGTARGAKAARDLTNLIESPAGGTDLIGAVTSASSSGVQQILVITDGQTWATQTSQEIKSCVHAILVGPGSLDAGVGHLATQTGGEVFYASGADTAPAIAAGLEAMRRGSTRTQGKVIEGRPADVECRRSGVELRAQWTSVQDIVERSDVIGRFAAALALPLLEDKSAATDCAVSHDLCCHLTSLVLIDRETKSDPGLPHTIRQPLERSIDILPMPRAAMDSSFGVSAALRDGGVYASRSVSTSSKIARPASTWKFVPKVVDWSDANKFLKADFSALPSIIRRKLERFAQEPKLLEFAAQSGLPPMLVALALYAEWQNDRHRNAQRLVSQVLGQAEATAVSDLVKALELA